MTWQPIETAPKDTKKMFIVIAINVIPFENSFSRYTSDPWCVWRDQWGGFERWPHAFNPTHWCPLPELPVIGN